MAAPLPIWAATGAKVSPSNEKISVGWNLGEKPPHEYMNWWMNTVVDRVNHILQHGVPLWDAATSYISGSLAKQNGLIYRAQATNQNASPAANPATWLQVSQNASALTTGVVPGARISGAYTGFTTITASGKITAASFEGSGADLTQLNAGRLDDGVVPNARLATSYTNIVNLTASGRVTANVFAGSGAELTNVPSASLEGNIPSGRLGASYIHMQDGKFNGNLNVQGILHVVGTISSASNINAAGTITAQTRFNGLGDQITGLNAGNIDAGTLANARLGASYTNIVNLAASGTLAVGSAATIAGSLVVDGSVTSKARIFAESGRYIGSGSVLILAAASTVNAPDGATIYFRPRNADNAAGQAYLGTNGELTAVKFAGDGGNLTGLNATELAAGVVAVARLPETEGATTWVRARYAAAPLSSVGKLAMLHYEGSANGNPGSVIISNGTNLFYSSCGQKSTIAPPNNSQWECLGFRWGSGDTEVRTALYQRVA